MNKIQFKTRKEVRAFLATKGIDTTNWSETKWLSINKGQAEIHIMALAEAIWDARNESNPRQLQAGEWHIPFVDKILNNSAIDYRHSKPEDADFHKSRIMFIVNKETIDFAPEDTPLTHTEYFGNVAGKTRGFILNDTVYTYRDNFIPVEDNVVKSYFKDKRLIAGGRDFFNYEYGSNNLIKIATAMAAESV